MKPVSVELIFHGRVQGVGFRATVREHAEAIGLEGWVRNEADGTVRLMTEGPQEAIHGLLERLKSAYGPGIIRIEQHEAVPGQEFSGFRILRA